jgi:hypothetical protein
MGLREETPENKANKAIVMGRKVWIKNSSIPLVSKKKQKHHRNYKQILILLLFSWQQSKTLSPIVIGCQYSDSNRP